MFVLTLAWLTCAAAFSPVLPDGRLVLSSTGGAAEWQGDVLGEYVKEGGGVGRSYYRQRDTVGKKDNFLYFIGGRWWISDVLGENTGYMRSSRTTRGSVGPPQSGWEYLGSGLAWQGEDTSLVLKWGALEPCSRVEVAAIGEVARIRRKELGTFTHRGDWIEGRPIYRNEVGEPRYLRLSENKPGWSVGPTPDITLSFTCNPCLLGFTLRGGRGTLSPGSLEAGPSVRHGRQGWHWKDSNGQWKETNGRLIVTCHTSNTGIKSVGCEVSPWSPWGSCSASCGGGSRSRSRQITRQAQGAEDKCPNLTDSQNCNTGCCPVDCEMSSWSPWNTCSASCGGGSKSRSRSITRQASCGGAICSDLIDSQPCNSKSCQERLLLSSTAGAAERQGGRMGEYVEAGTYSNRPYYKQRDDVGKTDQFLYYEEDGCTDNGWLVGPEVGGCESGLRNPSSKSPPPKSGWTFWAGGWQSYDRSFKLEFNTLEPCNEVVVAAQGKVAKAQDQSLGSYFPNGNWLEGRPVYWKQKGEIRYLRMSEGGIPWLISANDKGSNFFLQSGRGTLSPGDSAAGPSAKLAFEGWAYADSGKTLDSKGQVTVTCVP